MVASWRFPPNEDDSGAKNAKRMATKRKADELEELDLEIIRALQHDARRSLVKVAASLNVPESTVRNRLNRMVDRDLVEFAVATNPLRFGYDVWAIIEIQVLPTKIREVA